MKPSLCALVLLLVVVQPARAEDQPLAWDRGRPVADWISTGLVGANIAGSTWHAWRAERRGHALGCLALTNGLTLTVNEVVKRLVHRERPDGSDNKSFYSMHTALASVNAGWRVNVSIPIAIGAGYGRAAADKHFLSDIAVGAAAGGLTARICTP